VLETDKNSRSLSELHTTIQIRLGTALTAIQLLTVAVPFCDPLLVEIQADLRAALEATRAARALEAELTRRLAGSAPYRTPGARAAS
jgi:hypothetical protein